MKSELDTAWTFVMSWCTTNRNLPAFSKYPFSNNSPQNEDALNWDLYRLSLTRMTYLMEMFSHWRATCSYPLKRYRFQRLPSGKLQRFWHLLICRDGRLQESGICQHPRTRGHRCDGAFLPEVKCILTPHPDLTAVNLTWKMVQCQVKTTLVGTVMASALNSDALKQTNPPPSIGLVLSANLLRDKTALQWVTELEYGSSHLILRNIDL